MAGLSADRDARPVAGNTVRYERHRPERTLLYQIIAEYYPALQGRALPREPLRQWLLSVAFALRFLLASQPTGIGAVPGIVCRAIATHLVKKAGLIHASESGQYDGSGLSYWHIQC